MKTLKVIEKRMNEITANEMPKIIEDFSKISKVVKKSENEINIYVNNETSKFYSFETFCGVGVNVYCTTKNNHVVDDSKEEFNKVFEIVDKWEVVDEHAEFQDLVWKKELIEDAENLKKCLINCNETENINVVNLSVVHDEQFENVYQIDCFVNGKKESIKHAPPYVHTQEAEREFIAGYLIGSFN